MIIDENEEAEFEVSAIAQVEYDEYLEIENPESVDSCDEPVKFTGVADVYADALGCTVADTLDSDIDEIIADSKSVLADLDLVDAARLDDAIEASSGQVDPEPVFLFEPYAEYWAKWGEFEDCDCVTREKIAERVCKSNAGDILDNRQAIQISVFGNQNLPCIKVFDPFS